jgi:hypothetical protein
MPHELPTGFTKVSGNHGPTTGEWHIMLRCGAIDERIAYSPGQLVWKHNGGPGDIIAVRRVG